MSSPLYIYITAAGTIFVYGQTGAGKTYTMDAVTDLVLQQLYVYAAADDSSSEVAITVSAVELYNEVLRCLLSGRENLQLRWASGAGSFAGVVLEGAEERVSVRACVMHNWMPCAVFLAPGMTYSCFGREHNFASVMLEGNEELLGWRYYSCRS
jgi:hypothetical protein